MLEERLRNMADGLGPTKVVDMDDTAIKDGPIRDAELRFAPIHPGGAILLREKEVPESDPNGIGQHDPGCKLDSGKIRAGLLADFSLALMEVARVLHFGATKYSEGGWQDVPDGERRYRDAAWRHLLVSRHEELDSDSGLPHQAQALWNWLAAYELKLRRRRAGMAQDQFSAGKASTSPATEAKTN
jgi:hypothetical protein